MLPGGEQAHKVPPRVTQPWRSRFNVQIADDPLSSDLLDLDGRTNALAVRVGGKAVIDHVPARARADVLEEGRLLRPGPRWKERNS